MDDHNHHHNHHHTTTTTTTLSFLTKGSQVEVTSNTDDGFTGAWYVATVIHPPPATSSPNHHTNNHLVYVEYHNLLSEDGSSNRLREYANISYVRPSPVPDPNPPNFQINDLVDAFYKDGWCTGVIRNVLDSDNFVVALQNSSEEVQFRCSDLRIHKKWVGGRWLQPQKQVTAGWMYTVGKKVEVSFESESLRDVWFPATVLKNMGNSTFLVEYQQPGAGDEAIIHKVTVDYHHIRPSPPHLRDKNFVLLEKVDAYYDFGWWSGVITKELADNRYNVFFKNTKKEREFIYSKVRPHMEWKGGKWYNTSQGDTVVRTTPSLIDNQIEQATLIISKRSPIATSVMKKRQENLDSNNTSSQKGEIMNDDSSKTNKQPSVGQLEGFDSEASGMTDQAFSKTENLSHGKKVHSKRGKRVELKTPEADSSKKRGRLTNEVKSLQALAEGSNVSSMKTKHQEVIEKKDAADDSPLVVMGLQCSGMTVLQGKIVQKPPDENTPNVIESDTIPPGVPLAPLTVVDQGRSEGDAVSVAPRRKRGRPPKLQALSPKAPVSVDHEIGSVVPSALSSSVVKAGERKETGLTTSSGIPSLEENNGLVNELPNENIEKQNVPLTKDKLPNENAGQDSNARPGKGTKRYSSRKVKRGKRRTISINTGPPAQESRDASKADSSLEKDSPRRNEEASVGKSLVAVSDEQPLSRWFEGMQSPVTIRSSEGTMVQSSDATEGQCIMDFGNLPFIRTTSLWKAIESMEAFRMFPQKPHFRPLLEGVKAGAREGLAIGTMVTFSTVVDKTCSLKFDDPKSSIEDCLDTLVELENNGFDVEVIRERLTSLLLLKDKQEELKERSKGVIEKINEHKVQRKKIKEEIEEIDRQIQELEERSKQVVLKKEKKISEIGEMEAVIEEIEQEIREAGAEFNGLAAAPFVKYNID